MFPVAKLARMIITSLVIATALVSMVPAVEIGDEVAGVISWEGISFELPGEGWRKLSEVGGIIGFGRPLEQHVGQGLSVQLVEILPESLGLSRKEHASEFLEAQRGMTARGVNGWEVSEQEERLIGSVGYPAMKMRAIMDTEPEAVSEHLYLLYFPEDFDQRRKFYSFMWTEMHPTSKQVDLDASLALLDNVISSVAIRAEQPATLEQESD